jgi:hypothetical protein
MPSNPQPPAEGRHHGGLRRDRGLRSQGRAIPDGAAGVGVGPRRTSSPRAIHPRWPVGQRGRVRCPESAPGARQVSRDPAIERHRLVRRAIAEHPSPAPRGPGRRRPRGISLRPDRTLGVAPRDYSGSPLTALNRGATHFWERPVTGCVRGAPLTVARIASDGTTAAGSHGWAVRLHPGRVLTVSVPRRGEAVPHHSRADIVIARWREVERQLAHTQPGTPEADALQAEADSLRDEYQALVEAAQDADRRKTPPFSEGSVT